MNYEAGHKKRFYMDTDAGVRIIKPLVHGGPGSGHHGHEGIPGHRGGSAPSGITKEMLDHIHEQGKIVNGKHLENLKEWMGPNDDPQKELHDLGGRIKDWVGHSEVRVRVDAIVLEQIIKDGRFKTQYETQTSNGFMDEHNETRALVEKTYFGYPKDLPISQRPVYGYLVREGLAEDKDFQKWSLSQYGMVTIELKDDVKDRTTFTLDDSLGSAEADGGDYTPSKQRIEPIPMKDPDPDDYTVAMPTALSKEMGFPEPTRDFENEVSYIEAQVHGGVRVEDIKKVVFASKDDEIYLRDDLKKAGIPYEYAELKDSDHPVRDTAGILGGDR
jgi:hypothetical protein